MVNPGCIPFWVAWANLFARVSGITTGKLPLAHATRHERRHSWDAPVKPEWRKLGLFIRYSPFAIRNCLGRLCRGIGRNDRRA